MTDVSIIIINYKTPRLVVDAIRSVIATTEQVTYDFWVVDNASEDDSKSIITTVFPTINWLETGYNAGFARANNVAIRQAKGRYVLLLNADTLQTENLLDRLVERLDARPDVSAAAPLQMYEDGTPHPYYKSFNDFRRTFYLIPPRFLNWLEKLLHEPRYSDPLQHDWLVGAYLLVKKEATVKAGLLDEAFFMYGEDVEWSYRLGKTGKLLYFKDLYFYHLVNHTEFRRANVSYINRFSVQMQVSNLLWIRKQYGVGSYLVILLNYSFLIPIFWLWKIIVNILRGRNPIFETENQRLITRKTYVLWRYFWATLFRANNFFFKIKPKENIR